MSDSLSSDTSTPGDLRIIVNGQQAFGAEVFQALHARGEQIVAVYCGVEKPGSAPDPLRVAAEEAGVVVYQPSSFKDPQVAEEMAALKPDLMVMAFVTLVVPESVLNTPRLGSIQYHPSLLPAHRGPSAINWAIIHGDARTGLSIFWPDEGWDTGPVLTTREVDIEPDDTVGSLYFKKLFPLGVEAMIESVDLLRTGQAPRIVQNEAHATYESWCTKDDVRIDWDQPAEQVYARIRGGDPHPGAWSTINGQRVSFFSARLVAEPLDLHPGEVARVDDGLVIAARDGAVKIGRVKADAGKVPAAEYAEHAGIAPGMRFDT